MLDVVIVVWDGEYEPVPLWSGSRRQWRLLEGDAMDIDLIGRKYDALDGKTLTF